MIWVPDLRTCVDTFYQSSLLCTCMSYQVNTKATFTFLLTLLLKCSPLSLSAWAYGKGWPWTPQSFARACHALLFWATRRAGGLQPSSTLLDTPRRAPMLLSAPLLFFSSIFFFARLAPPGYFRFLRQIFATWQKLAHVVKTTRFPVKPLTPIYATLTGLTGHFCIHVHSVLIFGSFPERFLYDYGCSDCFKIHGFSEMHFWDSVLLLLVTTRGLSLFYSNHVPPIHLQPFPVYDERWSSS
jgi:hypothetical protein